MKKLAQSPFVIIGLVLFIFGALIYDNNKKNKKINKLLYERKMLILDHDDQLGEYKTLLNKITLDSINIRDANSLLMLQHLNNQKSLYDLYNELRKYKKELPPWGGKKPLDPEDKWTKNDT